MPEPITVTFSDEVRKIWKDPEGGTYSVLFMLMAAFYSVDEKNQKALEALNHSLSEKKSVRVTHDAMTSRIFDAAIE